MLFFLIQIKNLNRSITYATIYRSVLHPKNAYMTILRAALSQLYGKAEGYTLQDLPDIIMERKIELCQQLLEVLDVIEPGLSRIRGK